MARFAVIAGGRAAGRGPFPLAAGTRAPGLLEDLYRRHAAAVYARCRFLLRDDEAARDAAQDVFVRALRAGEEMGRASSPTAFLLRMATNHSGSFEGGSASRGTGHLAIHFDTCGA